MALKSARWSILTLCGLWTSSTLRETVWCLLGLRYSLVSSALLESVQLGRAAALPLWSWASMGCLISKSVGGPTSTIGCWMVCFENARCASQSLALRSSILRLHSSWAIMTPKSVNFFRYASQMPRFLAVVCATPCETIAVIEFGAIMNKMVSDSMYQARTSKVFFGGHCCSSYCRWRCGRCPLH